MKICLVCLIACYAFSGLYINLYWSLLSLHNKLGTDNMRCPGIPAHYIIAFMSASAMAVHYCLIVCLSVGIVAMVKHKEWNTTSDFNETVDVDTCPHQNIQSVTETQEDGEFEWNEEVQGYVLSAYYYGYMTTQTLGGRLAEKLGAKHIISSGIMLSAVLLLIVPTAARVHVYALMACRVLQGMAGGTVIPAMYNLITHWFPPEIRIQFSGIIFSCLHLGTLIAMSVSGLLANIAGWTSIFYFFGVISILWCLPWLFLIYDSPQQYPRLTAAEKSSISKNQNGEGMFKKTTSVPWFSIFTSAPVWAAYLINFGVSWEQYTLMAELPTYTKNMLHFNIQQSGTVSALPYVFDWLSCIAAGFLSRWIRSSNLLSQLNIYKVFNGIVAIGGSLCLLAISIVSCDATIITVLLCITLVTRGMFIAGSAMNYVDLAPNYSATLAGTSFTLSNLGGVLAPSIAGIIINGQQTLSKWRIVFYVAIGCNLLTYIFFLIFGSAEEQSWNQPTEKTIQHSQTEGCVNPAFDPTSHTEIAVPHNTIATSICESSREIRLG